MLQVAAGTRNWQAASQPFPPDAVQGSPTMQVSFLAVGVQHMFDYSVPELAAPTKVSGFLEGCVQVASRVRHHLFTPSVYERYNPYRMPSP